MSAKPSVRLPAKAKITAAKTRELTVKIKRYEPEAEDPIPSLFNNGWPRNVYPYGHREPQQTQTEMVNMRVIRLSNQYLEVDILPDQGGHIWGAKDLVSGHEIFHRVDALKFQHLGVAGAWMATGVEFNFPVTHSILTIDPINTTHGANPDGSAYVRIGATDKLFGLQWQITVHLRPDARCIEIDGWLHNPTDLGHPWCYWGNAGATTSEDLRLYYPFKYSEHHGGRLFQWPMDEGADLSYWRNLKQPISAFGETGDKRYFGGYYEDKQFGLVHTADPASLPGKKYFAWGNGAAGLRWAKLLSDHQRDYVELQSGSRTDQEFWNVLEPHGTVRFHERWQPIDGLGGITDANELLTVFVGREKGSAIVRAEPTEELKGVKFVAKDAAGAVVESWTADLTPTVVFTRKLAHPGPIRLEVDPGRHEAMKLSTEDFALYDYGPAPKTREEQRDPTELTSRLFRELAMHKMQVFAWEDAWTLFAEALRLDPDNLNLKTEIGQFRLRRFEFAEAKALLLSARAGGKRDRAVHWGLLEIAWATHDEALEKMILAELTEAAELAQVRSALLRKKPQEALAAVTHLSRHDLVRERDLGVAILVASRLAGKPDTLLLDEMDGQFPLDPAVRFERADGSFAKLLETDLDTARTLADLYLQLGDPVQALNAVEAGAAARGSWQLSGCVLAAHAAKLAGDSKAAKQYLSRRIVFEPLAERPWQDSYYAAMPAAIKNNPKDARLYWMQGNLFKRVGRTAEAAKAWRKAVQLGGDWPALHFAVALVDCRTKGCTPKAVTELAATVKQVNHHVYQSHYHYILLKSGRREELLEEYRSQLKLPHHHEGIPIWYALELVSEGQFDAALDYMLKTKFSAMHGGGLLTQAHIACRLARARKLIKSGKLVEARGELDQAFVIHHNFSEDVQVLHSLAEVYCVYGDVETKLGNLEKAQEFYTKAAHEDHDIHTPLRIWRSIGLIKSGHEKEGEETLKRIERMVDHRLTLDVDFVAHYHYLKSLLLLHRGKEAEARKQWTLARKKGWLATEYGYRF
ncbi:MAG: DUF5107 domain-containing protein [Planctomycetota bacterium]